MPRLLPSGKRDYRKDTLYESSPEQKRNRAKRNAARRQLAKEGLVRKGDGKDVDHVKSLKNGGSNKRSNLKAIPRSVNRSKK